MWWFRRRRRREPPPLVLPALERLAELIERVVVLLDASAPADEGRATGRHDPSAAPAEPLVHSVRSELVSGRHKALEPVPADAGPTGWVAFVSGSGGYRLADRGGAQPARGSVVDLDGLRYRVSRLGPSPLPGDRRRCAFLEREEPPGQSGKGHG